ncbi:MAG TPA: hypothetical protein VFR24_03760 [Candidatus Angelobacter sp.]|nr:hypothetical protein [Candidatus Angelobacter sp.]HET9364928.1 hypothetical protein [Candidatus Angelobacter sp.]
MAKFYIWFVVIVAGLAGLIRVVLPRRFAELQAERFKAVNALKRARWRSLIFVIMGIVFGSLYFLPWGHQSWIVIGTIFSLLGAAETFFQAQFPSLDALTFQSRLLGILYLGLAAASYVILART